MIGSLSVTPVTSVGTVDITLTWSHTSGSLDADYFTLYFEPGLTNPTVNSAVLATVDGASRDLTISGVPVENTYKVGIVASRQTASGIQSGSIVNSWQRIGVAANITAALNGSPASAVVSNAIDGANAWGKFTGLGNTLPPGNVDFNFAGSNSQGGSAINTDAVGSQNASNVQDAVINFSGRNDQNATPVISPTIAVDGTALDHTSNTDGSVDMSFEWLWAGNENDIDGFIVFARVSSSAASYNFGTSPAEELVWYVTPEKRSLIAYGLAADKYYTVGVKSYRVVDPNVHSSGFLASPIVQCSLVAEDPYRPSAGVSFNGDVTGTIDGTSTSGVKNTSITLSSNGTLLGAGGGSITGLDYGNVSGTKPPPSATENIFTTSTSNPSGGSDGDAHWNSNTSVMWFKTSGTWKAGGTVSASAIVTGTLGAARIAAGSITADKFSVTTLSAIVANLGTVNAGSITGSASIDITGQARFRGSVASIALVANDTNTATTGISTSAPNGGNGLWSRVSAATAIRGQADSASGTGIRAQNQFGGDALFVDGKMAINNSAKVKNLNADFLDSLSSSAFLQTGSTAADSNELGGLAASSWARIFVCNTGTCNASGAGININADANTGVRSNGSSNNVTFELIPSDRRSKKNIKPETLGLNFVKKLRPVTYNLIADDELTFHGVVYQDMLRLIPGNKDCLASLRADGKGTVAYQNLVSPLIKAVQELSKEAEASQIKINELTVTVANLKELLSTYKGNKNAR